jgi:hypothetical protein
MQRWKVIVEIPLALSFRLFIPTGRSFFTDCQQKFIIG